MSICIQNSHPVLLIFGSPHHSSCGKRATACQKRPALRILGPDVGAASSVCVCVCVCACAPMCVKEIVPTFACVIECACL